MKRFLFTICLMLLLATPAFAAEGESVRVAVIDIGVFTAAIAPQRMTAGHDYVFPQDRPRHRHRLFDCWQRSGSHPRGQIVTFLHRYFVELLEVTAPGVR